MILGTTSRPCDAQSLGWVGETARAIPVAYEVDVVVVGGSTGAVAAAVAAAKSGASVFLAAPYPYLGDDMTATLRLWLEPGESPASPLGKRLFDDPEAPRAEQGSPPSMPRPMHVKRVLDTALVEAGVPFLFGCYPTDLLRDAKGRPCGIVMANRAGRQAVLAKVIIDASPRAEVARLAGAMARPFAPGPRSVRWVVIGGEPREGPGLAHRVVQPPFRGPSAKPAGKPGGVFPVIEYTLDATVEADTPAAWSKAEQSIRERTYHPQQQFTADAMFFVPEATLFGRRPADGVWRGAEALPLEAFRPQRVEAVYVLSGSADLSPAQAAGLMRPSALVELGERIGAAAAEEAKSLPKPAGARLPGQSGGYLAAEGDVRETLLGTRPVQPSPTVPQNTQRLPVLGSYDVVVIGGGTSGAPAGIAAARNGVKTLVVEYLHTLGGVGTAGAISKYYWGNRVGFTSQVAGGDSWVIEQKAEWYRQQLLQAGGDVWFGAIGCGAFVKGNDVQGVVVATDHGRGVVLAKVVIDATGNADVAAAAGAACIYTDQTEFAMQGTGLPPRQLGASYTNTDFTLCDETDLVDVWRVFVHGKDKYPEAFDQGKLIDTRERRRVVGDFTLTILDIACGRTFADTVVRAHSNYDTHGYTIDPYLMLEHPLKKGVYADVPYRCLLPRGLEGMLVVGLGASAHRDALPILRMQPDLQNQGYAAGTAAAIAVRAGVEPRQIDVKALQRRLVELGNLPESVLTDRDSFPLPPERIAAAVESVAGGDRGVAVILAHPKESLPLLHEAYRQSRGPAKLTLAKILCVMGDPTGAKTVLEAVIAATEWDEGWDYRSQGQFGEALSPLDTLVVALGRAGDKEALPALVEKARSLTAQTAFSHHRAVALALELLGDPRGAAPLAEVLARPGIRGHAQTSLAEARREDPTADSGMSAGDGAVIPRRVALRELLLARALFRCGDHEGLGREILTQYTHDLRGHLARHAKAVLEAKEP